MGLLAMWRSWSRRTASSRLSGAARTAATTRKRSARQRRGQGCRAWRCGRPSSRPRRSAFGARVAGAAADAAGPCRARPRRRVRGRGGQGHQPATGTARSRGGRGGVPETRPRRCWRSWAGKWPSSPKRAAFAAGILELERRMKQQHKANPVSPLLAEVPGIGPVGALSLALTVDPGRFQSGRHFAAWLGLTPKQPRGCRAAVPSCNPWIAASQALPAMTKRDNAIAPLPFLMPPSRPNHPHPRKAAISPRLPPDHRPATRQEPLLSSGRGYPFAIGL